MSIVISILLFVLLSIFIYKNIVAIVQKIKEKKASKVQVDLHDNNNENKEIGS